MGWQGWQTSPFNPNREEPEYMIYKETIDTLIKNIKKHENSIYWLKAPAGSGKTTVFKWIEKNQQHNIRPVYMDMRTITDTQEINRRIKEETLTMGWERFLRGRKNSTRKHVLLMVDECDLVIDQKKFGAIIGWTSRLPHASVIFASVESIPHDVSTRAFRTRRVDRVMLEKPSVDVILDSIKKRVQHVGGNGFGPFTEDEVRAVIAAHPTIRDVLIDLEERCEGGILAPEVEVEEMLPRATVTGFMKADFSTLTEAQHKVFDILRMGGSLSIKEIRERTGIPRGSLAKHLQRLSNPGYCIETKKLPARVLTKNLDGTYRISDEIGAYVLPAGIPERNVKQVKKEIIDQALKGEEDVEEFVLKILKEEDAVSSDSSMGLDVLEIRIKEDKRFYGVDVKKLVDSLCDQGRLVLVDKKVFLV